MVTAYWEIGRTIVEAQEGKDRAEYGSALLKYLSENLTREFGKGYDERNLRNMRAFYLAFPIRNALRTELSWTHYRLLLKVENDVSRQFYLDECVKSSWSTRQLERQINSFFYERLLSSQDKNSGRREIQTLESGVQPKDVIRDPFVLEFLCLQHSPNLYEKDVEQGLVDHMQKFLMELGCVFSSNPGKNGYLLMADISILIWCFTIIC
jgi:predicted nuclease of restriction endonuclease-like (RecB) superfamily